MKPTCLLLIGIGSLASTASFAQSQRSTPEAFYRQDGTTVLTPAPVRQPAAPRDTTWDDLRAAIRRAHNPRVVLYWNRSLSERVVTEYDSVARANAYSQNTESSSSLEIDSMSGTRANLDVRREALDESYDFELEGAFSEALIGSGLKLIDRQTALRKAGMKLDDNRPNLQKLEMQALEQSADLLLEVLPTLDAEDGEVRRFRVALRNLKTGQTLVQFSTVADATVVTTSTDWVTTRKGYEKVTTSNASVSEDRGSRLARELAYKLIAIW